jgi:hypothetical protein
MHTPWPDSDDAQEQPSRAFAVGRWLIRVAAWDGMLPVVVWSLPLVALQLFPGRRGPVELLGVVLPITAFLIRFFVGVRAIRTNHCGRLVRGLQGIALWAGLFLLLIVDTLQILRLVMPPGMRHSGTGPLERSPSKGFPRSRAGRILASSGVMLPGWTSSIAASTAASVASNSS